MSDQPTWERDSIPLEGIFMYISVCVYQVYISSIMRATSTACYPRMHTNKLVLTNTIAQFRATTKKNTTDEDKNINEIYIFSKGNY